jgi:hypothetical protein
MYHLRIRDGATAKLLVKLSQTWNVAEHAEMCFTLVEAFRQSYRWETTHNMKGSVGNQIFHQFIFHTWSEQAVALLTDHENSVAAGSSSPNIAVYLLCSLLNAVGEREVIRNSQMLHSLKDKRGVDLVAFLEKVSQLAGDRTIVRTP